MTPRKSPDQLIFDCQGLVRTIAWKIHCKLPPSVELDDLISYGQVGLAEAAREYDPEKTDRFTTYAYYRIRGAILDGLAKMNWFSRAAFDQGRYERMAHEVLQDAGGLASPDPSDGRAPAASHDDDSPGSLADDARWFSGVSTALAVVQLFCRGGDGASPEANIADPEAEQPEDNLMNRELVEKLHEFLGDLPEDGRKLIHAAYFEGLTLTEAGKRLGISKAWASRLHAKTLGQLADSFRVARMIE